MLVIRRRAGESILIGADIEIQVIDITSSRVKIGIRAPRQVPVLRKEIQLAGEENLAAARWLAPEAIAALALRFRG